MKYKFAAKIALLASALAVGAADAAVAQQRTPRPPRPTSIRQDSVKVRAGARRAMPRPAHPASALLRMREQLQLSDAQVQRLEAMQKSPVARVSESALMRARADLLDATRGDGNPEAARAALERISRLHTDQQVARIRARKESRDVLTTEQKSKLDQFQSRLVDRRLNRASPMGRAHARPGRPAAAANRNMRRDSAELGPPRGLRRGIDRVPPRRDAPPPPVRR
jgi:Spy/CpxP family protein refolding chaperone